MSDMPLPHHPSHRLSFLPAWPHTCRGAGWRMGSHLMEGRREQLLAGPAGDNPGVCGLGGRCLITRRPGVCGAKQRQEPSPPLRPSDAQRGPCRKSLCQSTAACPQPRGWKAAFIRCLLELMSPMPCSGCSWLTQEARWS